MTRRTFLKWLLIGIAALAAGTAALFRLLGRDGSNGGDPVAETPDVTPVDPVTKPSPQEQPLDVTIPLFSMFLLSDAHINQDTKKEADYLKRAFKDMLDLDSPVEAIALGGDLTDYGRDGDYRLLQDTLKAYQLPPVFANMGNHDYYNIWIDKNGQFNREAMPNGKTDALSREKFMKQFGYQKVYNDAWFNDVHLIMMSQEAYVQEKPDVGEGAWYSDEQLTWLKHIMAEHKDGRPALIYIHQPLPAVGRDGGTHSVIRANAFREILEPYPNTFVFSGHSHTDFEFVDSHYRKESFHWFTNSSVGRVLNRRYQSEHPDRSQGMYIQVFPDRVELSGREFSIGTWIEGAKWTVPLVSAKV
jgi:3',5'-cyclic-AMP phosphodiesterase